MLATASILCLTALLGACGKPSAPERQGQAEAVATAPDAKPGLSITGARLVLPVVSGNPGAVYFAVTNASDRPAQLVAAHFDGAGSAEIHDTSAGKMSLVEGVPLAPGETVKFAPGARHVMVFDIQDTVKVGTTIEMTLTFADGDKVSAPLKVETVAGNDTAEIER